MKSVEFNYYMTFGMGDSGDSYCSVALEDNAYQRLAASAQKAAEEGWTYMSQDPDIADIYAYVRSEIMDMEADFARDLYDDVLTGFFMEDMTPEQAAAFDLSEISNEEIADWLTTQWPMDIWYPRELMGEE